MAKITLEDVPDEVRKICREWFDGTNSAMYALTVSEPVDPDKLRLEFLAILNKSTDLVKRDYAALKAGHDYAYKMVTVQRAKSRLRDAIIAVAHERDVRSVRREISEVVEDTLQELYGG